MTSFLHVLSPGMFTTIQDLGRFGHQDLGVPVAGALDPINLRLANALVGNPEDTGALEIRIMGPSFRIESDAVRVALCGTDAEMEISGTRQHRIPSGQSIRLRRGEIVQFSAIRDTSCCYLAIEGGFDLPTPFASQSTYVRGGFGGFEGRALQQGDDLPLLSESVPARPESYAFETPVLDSPAAIRVVLGPQDNYFTEAGLRTFLEGEFTITQDADRMGLRLDGPALEHSIGFNIASDGIVTGSIQVPGTGKPIILLADHQTTGGYPKIATVISVDLPRLGRMRPGRKLRFEAVSVADAEQARRDQEEMVRRSIGAIGAVDEMRQPDGDKLLSMNLISGVFYETE
ncbi:MAG: biotin-dependent carboxyltransferase [Alphaproteobacteria bacterium]|nr:biotin-dependent carboxyltransferase [Alphaproteobacteria bacterium]